MDYKPIYYRQTSFDISDRTKFVILKTFENIWNSRFDHDIEYQFTNKVLLRTNLALEISKFLQLYKLDFQYAGIQFFTSNLTESENTNPHVDVLHRQGLLPIRSRFNILVLGNPSDPMVWWNNVKWGDSSLQKTEVSYKGTKYYSYAIKGENVLDLGPPSFIKQNLLMPSAFVSTHYAHALNLSKGPRLVISVPLEKEISDYIN
jgi:hypothetical protein